MDYNLTYIPNNKIIIKAMQSLLMKEKKLCMHVFVELYRLDNKVCPIYANMIQL